MPTFRPLPAQYIETTHTEPQLLDEGRERILAVLPPFHIYALDGQYADGHAYRRRVDPAYPVRHGCSGEGHFREEGYGLSRRTNDVCRDHQPSRRRKPRFVFDQVVRVRWSPSSPGGPETLPGYFRLPFGRGLGHDRNVTHRYVYAAGRCGEAGLMRDSNPWHHHQVCRRRRSVSLRWRGRKRRDLYRRSQRHEGILEAGRCNARKP